MVRWKKMFIKVSVHKERTGRCNVKLIPWGSRTWHLRNGDHISEEMFREYISGSGRAHRVVVGASSAGGSEPKQSSRKTSSCPDRLIHNPIMTMAGSSTLVPASKVAGSSATVPTPGGSSTGAATTTGDLIPVFLSTNASVSTNVPATTKDRTSTTIQSTLSLSSMPVPSSSKPGSSTQVPTTLKPGSGSSTPVPASSKPGSSTQVPTTLKPGSGSSTQVPASSKPGSSTPAPTSSKPGSSTQVPTTLKPGSGSPTPVPSSSKPGSSTQVPTTLKADSGSSTPVPVSSKPGSSTQVPTTLKPGSGSSTPVPASSKPGSSTQVPTTMKPDSGSSTPVPSSSKPGSSTQVPTTLKPDSGSSTPVPTSSKPGSSTQVPVSTTISTNNASSSGQLLASTKTGISTPAATRKPTEIRVTALIKESQATRAVQNLKITQALSGVLQVSGLKPGQQLIRLANGRLEIRNMATNLGPQAISGSSSQHVLTPGKTCNSNHVPSDGESATKVLRALDTSCTSNSTHVSKSASSTQDEDRKEDEDAITINDSTVVKLHEKILETVADCTKEECVTLKTKNTELLAEVKKHDATHKKFQVAIGKKNAKIDHLESQLRERDETLEQKDVEIIRKKEDFEMKCEEMKSLDEKLRTEALEHANEIMKKEYRIQQLRKLIEATEAEKDEEVRKMSAEVQKKSAEIDTKDDELERLREELLKMSEDAVKLERTLEDKLREYDLALKTKDEIIEVKSQDFVGLSNEIEFLREKIAYDSTAHGEDMNILREKLAVDSAMHVEELKCLREKLASDSAEHVDEINKKNDEIRELKDSIAAGEQLTHYQMRRECFKNQTKDKELKRLREELFTTTQDAMMFEKSLKKRTKLLSEKDEEVGQLKRALASNAQVLIERDDQIEKITAVIGERDAEIERLKDVVSTLSNNSVTSVIEPAPAVERDDEIEKITTVIGERDAEIERLKDVVSTLSNNSVTSVIEPAPAVERDDEIEKITTVIGERDAEIERLKDVVSTLSKDSVTSLIEPAPAVDGETGQHNADEILLLVEKQTSIAAVSLEKNHKEKSFEIEQKEAEIRRLRDELAKLSADSVARHTAYDKNIDVAKKNAEEILRLTEKLAAVPSGLLEKNGIREKCVEIERKDLEIRQLTEKLESISSERDADVEKNVAEIRKRDEEIRCLTEKLVSISSDFDNIGMKLQEKDSEILSLIEKLASTTAMKIEKEDTLSITPEESSKNYTRLIGRISESKDALSITPQEVPKKCTRPISQISDSERLISELKDRNSLFEDINAKSQRCCKHESDLELVSETLKNEREKSKILEKCLEEMRLLDDQKDTRITKLEKKCRNLARENVDLSGKIWYLGKVCENKRDKMAALTEELAVLATDMSGLVKFEQAPGDLNEDNAPKDPGPRLQLDVPDGLDLDGALPVEHVQTCDMTDDARVEQSISSPPLVHQRKNSNFATLDAYRCSPSPPLLVRCDLDFDVLPLQMPTSQTMGTDETYGSPSKQCCGSDLNNNASDECQGQIVKSVGQGQILKGPEVNSEGHFQGPVDSRSLLQSQTLAQVHKGGEKSSPNLQDIEDDLNKNLELGDAVLVKPLKRKRGRPRKVVEDLVRRRDDCKVASRGRGRGRRAAKGRVEVYGITGDEELLRGQNGSPETVVEGASNEGQSPVQKRPLKVTLASQGRNVEQEGQSRMENEGQPADQNHRERGGQLEGQLRMENQGQYVHVEQCQILEQEVQRNSTMMENVHDKKSSKQKFLKNSWLWKRNRKTRTWSKRFSTRVKKRSQVTEEGQGDWQGQIEDRVCERSPIELNRSDAGGVRPMQLLQDEPGNTQIQVLSTDPIDSQERSLGLTVDLPAVDLEINHGGTGLSPDKPDASDSLILRMIWKKMQIAARDIEPENMEEVATDFELTGAATVSYSPERSLEDMPNVVEAFLENVTRDPLPMKTGDSADVTVLREIMEAQEDVPVLRDAQEEGTKEVDLGCHLLISDGAAELQISQKSQEEMQFVLTDGKGNEDAGQVDSSVRPTKPCELIRTGGLSTWETFEECQLRKVCNEDVGRMDSDPRTGQPVDGGSASALPVNENLQEQVGDTDLKMSQAVSVNVDAKVRSIPARGRPLKRRGNCGDLHWKRRARYGTDAGEVPEVRQSASAEFRPNVSQGVVQGVGHTLSIDFDARATSNRARGRPRGRSLKRRGNRGDLHWKRRGRFGTSAREIPEVGHSERVEVIAEVSQGGIVEGVSDVSQGSPCRPAKETSEESGDLSLGNDSRQAWVSDDESSNSHGLDDLLVSATMDALANEAEDSDVEIDSGTGGENKIADVREIASESLMTISQQHGGQVENTDLKTSRNVFVDVNAKVRGIRGRGRGRKQRGNSGDLHWTRRGRIGMNAREVPVSQVSQGEVVKGIPEVGQTESVNFASKRGRGRPFKKRRGNSGDSHWTRRRRMNPSDVPVAQGAVVKGGSEVVEIVSVDFDANVTRKRAKRGRKRRGNSGDLHWTRRCRYGTSAREVPEVGHSASAKVVATSSTVSPGAVVKGVSDVSEESTCRPSEAETTESQDLSFERDGRIAVASDDKSYHIPDDIMANASMHAVDKETKDTDSEVGSRTGKESRIAVKDDEPSKDLISTDSVEQGLTAEKDFDSQGAEDAVSGMATADGLPEELPSDRIERRVGTGDMESQDNGLSTAQDPVEEDLVGLMKDFWGSETGTVVSEAIPVSFTGSSEAESSNDDVRVAVDCPAGDVLANLEGLSNTSAEGTSFDKSKTEGTGQEDFQEHLAYSDDDVVMDDTETCEIIVPSKEGFSGFLQDTSFGHSGSREKSNTEKSSFEEGFTNLKEFGNNNNEPFTRLSKKVVPVEVVVAGCSNTLDNMLVETLQPGSINSTASGSCGRAVVEGEPVRIVPKARKKRARSVEGEAEQTKNKRTRRLSGRSLGKFFPPGDAEMAKDRTRRSSSRLSESPGTPDDGVKRMKRRTKPLSGQLVKSADDVRSGAGELVGDMDNGGVLGRVGGSPGRRSGGMAERSCAMPLSGRGHKDEKGLPNEKACTPVKVEKRSKSRCQAKSPINSKSEGTDRNDNIILGESGTSDAEVVDTEWLCSMMSDISNLQKNIKQSSCHRLSSWMVEDTRAVVRAYTDNPRPIRRLKFAEDVKGAGNVLLRWGKAGKKQISKVEEVGIRVMKFYARRGLKSKIAKCVANPGFVGFGAKRASWPSVRGRGLFSSRRGGRGSVAVKRGSRGGFVSKRAGLTSWSRFPVACTEPKQTDFDSFRTLAHINKQGSLGGRPRARGLRGGKSGFSRGDMKARLKLRGGFRGRCSVPGAPKVEASISTEKDHPDGKITGQQTRGGRRTTCRGRAVRGHLSNRAGLRASGNISLVANVRSPRKQSRGLGSSRGRGADYDQARRKYSTESEIEEAKSKSLPVSPELLPMESECEPTPFEFDMMDAGDGTIKTDLLPAFSDTLSDQSGFVTLKSELVPDFLTSLPYFETGDSDGDVPEICEYEEQVTPKKRIIEESCKPGTRKSRSASKPGSHSKRRYTKPRSRSASNHKSKVRSPRSKSRSPRSNSRTPRSSYACLDKREGEGKRTRRSRSRPVSPGLASKTSSRSPGSRSSSRSLPASSDETSGSPGRSGGTRKSKLGVNYLLMNRYGLNRSRETSESVSEESATTETDVHISDNARKPLPSLSQSASAPPNFQIHKSGRSPFKAYLSQFGSGVNINDFGSVPRLGIPVETGSDEENLSCKICGKVFINQALLARHRMAFHTSEERSKSPPKQTFVLHPPEDHVMPHRTLIDCLAPHTAGERSDSPKKQSIATNKIDVNQIPMDHSDSCSAPHTAEGSLALHTNEDMQEDLAESAAHPLSLEQLVSVPHISEDTDNPDDWSGSLASDDVYEGDLALHISEEDIFTSHLSNNKVASHISVEDSSSQISTNKATDHISEELAPCHSDKDLALHISEEKLASQRSKDDLASHLSEEDVMSDEEVCWQYLCEICSETFPDNKQLTLHKETTAHKLT